MNVKGLKAWLLLIAAIIVIIASLIILLGVVILFLPLISFLVIFGVIYAMIGKYRENYRIRKQGVIDIKVKKRKGGKTVSVKKK